MTDDYKTIDDKTTRLSKINNPQRILWAGLALGWGVDLLFYGKQVGVSLLLFALAVLAVLWQISRSEDTQPVRGNLWLILPLLFFAVMGMIRANVFLTTMNVLAVLAILSYLVFYFASGRVEETTLAGALTLPLRVGSHGIVAAAPLVAESVDVKEVAGYGRRGFFPLLRGGLLALPVLFVFTLLLASADLVFADYVETFLDLDFPPDLFELIWRGILILIAAWLLAGSLVYLLRRRDDEDDISLLEAGLARFSRTLPIGFIETAVILSLVNLLFLLFTAIQFAYLFGGIINIDLDGYTYAEYARRGFFELVTTAVLSLSLILGLNWLARRESKRQIRLFNQLASLMIGFVGVMLLSAFQRMRLYEATFGYTELRLIVFVFMFWLGVVLGWFLLTLWRGPHRFTIGLIMSAAGFLATLNLINPDTFIARQNLARYLRTNDLDATYLTQLSDDALPQLAQALVQVQHDDQLVPVPACTGRWFNEEWVADYEDCQATPHQILQDELDGRYQSRLEDTDWRRWQSFHLARWRAFSILNVVIGNQ
jgi:hypothetical protein